MKPVVLFTIFFFSLLCLTISDFAKPPGGNLMGFVYGKDGKTPVQHAMVLIRGLNTGIVYQSKPTGEFGIYRFLGIEPGTYVVGLKLKEKSYNVNDYVKVAAGKTSFVSLSLLSPQLEITYKPVDIEKEKEGKKKFFDTLLDKIFLIGGASGGILVADNLAGGGEELEASPTTR